MERTLVSEHKLMCELYPAPFSMEKFYYVYILKNEKEKSLYIGFTNNLEERLDKHNQGLVKYTQRKVPWKLVCFEGFNNEEDARKREKNLKYFGKAYGQLKGRISSCLCI